MYIFHSGCQQGSCPDFGKVALQRVEAPTILSSSEAVLKEDYNSVVVGGMMTQRAKLPARTAFQLLRTYEMS